MTKFEKIQDLITAYERIQRLEELEKALKKEKEQSNLIEDLATENQECY